MAIGGTHVIVFANEKGGTGKSTTAVHVAVALAAGGARVAAIDLDHRQRTLARYLENRTAAARKKGLDLVQPAHRVVEDAAGFDDAVATLADGADFLVIDTPGRDDPLARQAARMADTLVTPMNDSFVDFDLIGQVDADSYKVTRPSFYSELIWDTRKERARADGATIDWVVLRNRLQHIEARNMRRVGEALTALSKRVGFRLIPGLGERVIYRELFPSGLTLLDIGALPDVGIAHVAARQELRELVAALQLPQRGAAPAPAATAALAS